jgi:hypothetical protein
MTLQPKLRKPLLAAVLAAFAASSWAAYEYNSTLVPAPSAEAQPRIIESDGTTTTVATPIVLEPNETVVIIDERPGAVPAPVVASSPAIPAADRSEPAIEVTKPRLTPDQRIQADVMDLLARNPNLSGQIGVVSADRVVTLTGWTTTSGQAWRAGRDARGVEGVRHVVNEIRPRVGGITS